MVGSRKALLALLTFSLLSACSHAKRTETGCGSRENPECSNLAYQYLFGKGVQQNFSKAAALFTSACERGFGPACAEAAVLHLQGKGVPASTALADNLLSKSGLGGSNMAYTLGTFYYRGMNAPKSTEKALVLFQRACEIGQRKGCAALGDHFAGMGNNALAQEWNAKACRLGVSRKCVDKDRVPASRAVKARKPKR